MIETEKSTAESRPPQGIVVRTMNTGDPKRDFHKKHRSIRMIDPKSLIVDGKEPALALPIPGEPGKVRVRRVEAHVAAEMLTCDFASGGKSVHRLATDAEVAQFEAEALERAGNRGMGGR